MTKGRSSNERLAFNVFCFRLWFQL